LIFVSDYIVKYLEDIGVEYCFSVVGGGAMFLNQSFGKSKKIKTIYFHHEQSASIAAEGYSRTTGKLAVVCVTSGPGGLNTLTGVMGQWTDSVPVLYISGQVKYETTIQDTGLRQLGDQEVDIVSVVKPLTKYAEIIKNSYYIKSSLDSAIHECMSNRRGPSWIDIPLDIQNSYIEENKLCDGLAYDLCLDDLRYFDKAFELLTQSKKPLIIAGHGIRLSNAQKEFYELLKVLNIPVVTTFNGFDLLTNDHENWIGRIGTLGSRVGNFALQNADLILCLGTRNNIRQISYDWKNFGKNARKIIVDIDLKELNKPTIKGDLVIHTNIKNFINYLLPKIFEGLTCTIPWLAWLNWCLAKKEKYPIVEKIHYENKTKGINPYIFINELTKKLKNDATIICGNGTACVSYFQAGIVKERQRVFWNSGCASMGYGLPAAIGACFANNKKEVICIDGDGSLQMNLQELQTIKHHNLPIKLFVLNNNGYHSIVQTQTNFFGKENIVGCNEKSGVSFPDLRKIAKAYGIRYGRIDNVEDLNNNLDFILCGFDVPFIIEVFLTTDYIFAPKLSSVENEEGKLISRPLENMYPFLDEKELMENMQY